MSLKFICLFAVLAVAYLQGTSAIKCYLCVGSPSSDCASNKLSSMVVQDCKPIHIHGWTRRFMHQQRHPNSTEEPESTTTVNDIINNSMTPTPRPELAQELNNQMNEDGASTTTPQSVQPEVWLEATCMYLRVKDSNRTTSLVTRGCGYMPPKKDFCTVVKKYNKNVSECKSCDTDECN